MADGRTPWLVYGLGAVAIQVLRSSGRTGLDLALAGRDPERLNDLACWAGVRGYSAEIGDDLAKVAKNYAGIINLTGPGAVTSALILDICLEQRLHYIDVSNEFTVHQVARQRDREARDKGVAVVSGAGMGTWCGERLMKSLMNDANEATQSATLISLPSVSRRNTPGAVASHAGVLAAEGVIIKNGAQSSVLGEKRIQELASWTGYPAGVVIATGDVIAIQESTNACEVRSLAAITEPADVARNGFKRQISMARSASEYRGFIEQSVPTAHTSLQPETVSKDRYLGEIITMTGRRFRGVLRAGSGTHIAAHIAITTAQTLSKRCLRGTHTVYQAIGDKPLDGLDNVQVEAINAER